MQQTPACLSCVHSIKMECDEALTLARNPRKLLNDALYWMERNRAKVQERSEKRTKETIANLEQDNELAKLRMKGGTSR